MSEETVSRLEKRIRELEIKFTDFSDQLKELLESVKGIGGYKLRNCTHNYGGLCHAWHWDKYPEHIEGIFRIE